MCTAPENTVKRRIFLLHVDPILKKEGITYIDPLPIEIK
jgi:hypothetical protein